MRSAASGEAWDRIVPALVLPYAIWTVYVHLIVWQQASFTTLLQWLPLVLAVAVAATVGWFRLRGPAAGPESLPEPPGPNGGNLAAGAAPFACLALAACWVGLLAAGMPYPVFWWGAVLAMCGAWARNLRAGTRAPPVAAGGTSAVWIVSCLVVAAIGVVLVAHRPNTDDAFYLSIPATLLRFPEQPVLLHDTLYRLQDTPILLPFYRLASYGVLVAVFTRATGIDHLAVNYLVLPAFFAATGVLAWVYLLRRIAPARWPIVLLILFACVVALGEATRAYGNFAFVRLFQGKAILATCLVPAIAAAALDYARHGGLRHWLLLLAAQVAALGVSPSALFVAPAAAALGLAGGWSADVVRSRRFVAGLLASAYLLAAAWLVATGTRGGQVLAVASPAPMPGVPEILEHTWGAWSMQVLLVALLAAWAFVRDPAHARYFSAGAFFFLLVALNPYTVPFVADHSIGAKTYWRLTWALPLPFFLAVAIDGIVERVLRLKPKPLAVGACLAAGALFVAFTSRSGTLLCRNSVTLASPGLKVPPVEYGVARRLAELVPEQGTVLAPEAVSAWLPIFVAHPQPIGVRHSYLSLAFTPRETAQRSNMMRYVSGRYRPPDAQAWFRDSIRRYRVTAVVVAGTTPWRDEIAGTLGADGWRLWGCDAYGLLLPGELRRAPEGCRPLPIPSAP